MWLSAKSINKTINKAVITIVGKISLEDIKDKATKLVRDAILGDLRDPYRGNRCVDYVEDKIMSSVRHQVIEDFRRIIVDDIIKEQKLKIVEKISGDEFTDLIREGLKERFKQNF